MPNRFVRKIVDTIMNFPILKVLAWSVPVAIVVGALASILIFSDKSVLALLITGGGSFVAGRFFAHKNSLEKLGNASQKSQGEDGSTEDQQSNS